MTEDIINRAALTGIDQTLFFRVVESTNTGIVITDNSLPDNPIIYCNPAFEQMSGYKRIDIIGHNCRFLQGKDRKQAARGIVHEAISNGRSCVVEIRNYTKEGKLFWNELYISPVTNDEGVVTHFIGIQNDVSSRKKSQLELERVQIETEKLVIERTKMYQESQDFMTSIVETLRESLLVIDHDFTILSANAHFLNTFKVSINETKGRLLYDLGNGQWNIPELKRMMEDILPTNNPVLDYEVEHEFPHIGKKLMLLNAHRVELEGQYKNWILLAIEDITERRAVQQRKDDFLSIASHELKTPLTTVVGYLQLMKRLMPAEASEKFRSIADKTERYVHRLNHLLSDLLDVSRIQTGNIEIHKEPFDFDKMLIETIEGIRAATPQREILLKGSVECQCNADESHIIQVVSNLLGNAIKYSPDNTPVTVQVTKISDVIKFSVTDKGIGITEADYAKIFDRFYRVAEVQRHYSGMGIGLYICQQIILNHGGTIWVESKRNVGSTFNFTIPIQG
ncbi:PAS domain S-box-containing protein [Pedobacter westerhofensis]|uniref:histidine kinase n=1 Tax=Pedobacter westerhofensis TaxID=425512 RepID=A0A521FN17_9SPHI|nr:PAS domain-containing protein [Pedobacter westerhofensis]SMO96970.1 PAS domain S-box-containing protein [Pedobacter westerhofensis]